MSTENLNNLWGTEVVDDNNPELVSKGRKNYGEFGLNPNVEVTEFKFYDAEGENDAFLQMEVKFGDKPEGEDDRPSQRTRVYDPKSPYIDGQKIDSSHKDYAKHYAAEVFKVKGYLTHLIKAFGITPEQISKKLQAVQPKNFEEYVKAISSLVPDNPGTKVDLFLEYQYNVPDGYDKAFLQIPRNMKGGKFIVPVMQPIGEWKEKREKNSKGEDVKLWYEDNAGNKHEFTRNETFLNSPKAIQSKIDSDEEEEDETNPFEDKESASGWDED